MLQISTDLICNYLKSQVDLFWHLPGYFFFSMKSSRFLNNKKEKSFFLKAKNKVKTENQGKMLWKSVLFPF